MSPRAVRRKRNSTPGSPAPSPAPRLTREEALAYVHRYQLVNAIEIEELRRMTPLVRLRQIASLWKLAKGLGFKRRRGEARETQEVIRRWALLKRRLV